MRILRTKVERSKSAPATPACSSSPDSVLAEAAVLRSYSDMYLDLDACENWCSRTVATERGRT